MQSYASCNANSKGRVEHVRRLLEHVFKLGIKVKLLLFDGGYYSIDMINYVNSAGIKFVMWMGDYGKIEAGSGLIFTTNSPYRDKQATFMVVAKNGTYRYGKSELFIFVTNRVRQVADGAGIEVVENEMVTGRGMGFCCGGPLGPLDSKFSDEMAMVRAGSLNGVNEEALMFCPLCYEKLSPYIRVKDYAEVISI